MAKIGAIDFTNNVERNRKALRQHCLENGKQVLEGETLDNIVAMNNEIKTGTVEGQFKVEFKDLDGNYFAPTQYVNYGESATLPDGYPELDPDLLEFDYWATSASDSLDNVQRDILCLPQYKTKYDEATGQRPTYLICYFDEGALSPTLNFRSTRTNTFVDWGDGSTAKQVTSSTISHTYSRAGLYTIKIYGDSYSVGGHNSYGVFTTQAYETSLLKAYIGENAVYTDSMAKSSTSLEKLVLTKNMFAANVNSQCYGCYSLKAIVIPNGVVYVGSYFATNCKSLTDIVIPTTVTRMETNTFSKCSSLLSVTIPEGVDSLSGTFDSCYSLKKVVLPNNLKTLSGQLLMSCHSLSNIILPNGLSEIGDVFQNCYALSHITIPDSVKKISLSAFSNTYTLHNIVLYQDFNMSLDLYYSSLYDECLIDIANKVKDNTGLSAQRIKFSSKMCQTRMQTIMLNEFGERVPYGTAGAVSILEFMQNKNWTIAFA